MSSFPQIIVTPPGPKARILLREDERFVSPSYSRYYPLVIDSAKDCIVKDVDGNEYIDLNAGVACHNVGHNNPKVVGAIKSQCDKFLHCSASDFYSEQVVDLAAKLAEVTPGSFEKKTYFGTSGAEAIESAIKLAKWHTRKQLFIAFINAFHGNTVGSLSLTAHKPIQRSNFFPLMPGVTHVPYGYCYRCAFKMTYPDCDCECVDFIEDHVLQKYVPSEDVAAVIFEPIQGEGGYVVPPSEYFQKVKKLADKYGFLTIADEFQSGIGRTGKWFAIENWGIEPDVICGAKALASGLPIGVVTANSKIMDWSAGSHAGTSGGNSLSCAAALAVIDVVKTDRLLDNANKQGAYALKKLAEFKDENTIVGDVRGKGLMIGIELVEDKDSKKPAPEKAHEAMIYSWQRGVAITTCGVSTLRLSPPLTVTKDLLDTALDIIIDTINEVAREE